MNFLCNLEFLMDRNNINRSELAKAIGIAPSTINAWYTKDYKGITLKNLSKLASFFDISMEALVYGDQSSLTFTLENYTEAELKAIYDFSQYIKEKRSSEHLKLVFNRLFYTVGMFLVSACGSVDVLVHLALGKNTL